MQAEAKSELSDLREAVPAPVEVIEEVVGQQEAPQVKVEVSHNPKQEQAKAEQVKQQEQPKQQEQANRTIEEFKE